MNKKRRELIRQSVVYMEMGKNILKQVLNDEEMAFDNLSDGLQQTRRGDDMQENIDTLNDVVDAIDDIFDNLDNIL